MYLVCALFHPEVLTSYQLLFIVDNEIKPT